MNLDEKPPNGVESKDPANNAASLAQVTLKSPKPGNGGAKQRRAKNASDAMGGAGAKDKPSKSKSRKKALNFDDLAQATASIEAAAAARANVVSINEVRTPAETSAAPDVAAAAAAPAPVVEVPAEAADLIPTPAAEFTPEAEGDSMDAALDLPQTQLMPEAEEAPVAQMEAEPIASEPEPAAPVAKPAPAARVEPPPAFLASNGHGTEAPAAESEPKAAA